MLLAGLRIDQFLDLSRPIAVLLFLALPFVPDEDDPAGTVAAYREATAPGSYIALTHGTGDYRPQAISDVRDVYEHASHSMTLRSKERIAHLLRSYELLEPGVVDTAGGRTPAHRPTRSAAMWRVTRCTQPSVPAAEELGFGTCQSSRSPT